MSGGASGGAQGAQGAQGPLTQAEGPGAAPAGSGAGSDSPAGVETPGSPSIMERAGHALTASPGEGFSVRKAYGVVKEHVRYAAHAPARSFVRNVGTQYDYGMQNQAYRAAVADSTPRGGLQDGDRPLEFRMPSLMRKQLDAPEEAHGAGGEEDDGMSELVDRIREARTQAKRVMNSRG